jgi:hypothetical protein
MDFACAGNCGPKADGVAASGNVVYPVKDADIAAIRGELKKPQVTDDILWGIREAVIRDTPNQAQVSTQDVA